MRAKPFANLLPNRRGSLAWTPRDISCTTRSTTRNGFVSSFLWKSEAETQGEYLALQGDALILYEYEYGRAVWGVGHCLPVNHEDTPTNERTVTIDEQGWVTLGPAEGGTTTL